MALDRQALLESKGYSLKQVKASPMFSTWQWVHTSGRKGAPTTAYHEMIWEEALDDLVAHAFEVK